MESERYVWQGSDEYDDLGDRKDEAPLPLPAIDFPVRVVLVRHGQSTWNAEGRVQGSCNLSVLTDKGKGQAQTTRDLVCLTSSTSSSGCLLAALFCRKKKPFSFQTVASS